MSCYDEILKEIEFRSNFRSTIPQTYIGVGRAKEQ